MVQLELPLLGEELPRGKHEIGFKELSWDKKTLDEFINKMRRNRYDNPKENNNTHI